MKAKPRFLLLLFALCSLAPATPVDLLFAQSSAPGSVVLNEVQYDPPEGGSEAAREWVELLNVSEQSLRLDGWMLADNRSSDTLPALELPPGGFVVVAGGEGFAEAFPDFTGRLVTLGGSIGNGLGNGGDQVRLLDAQERLVDGLSWGNDTSQLDPPVPDVSAGHSLERIPAGRDSDSADDWFDQPSPSPGGAAGDLRPTEVPTAAPLPSVAPDTVVLLNEHLPAPRAIDWDGDGTADQDDEWVELFNPGDVAIDLRGWQIDDVAAGGSPPYTVPDGTHIAPRGYLIVFKRDSDLSLNNSGDSIRLLHPDGSQADAHSYSRSMPDASYGRLVDGELPWTDALPPSPGGPNGDPASSNTPAHPTPTPGAITPTPAGPTHTSTSTSTSTSTTTPSGPTPTADPDTILLPILISEVLFDPLAGGADAALEWIELHNPGDRPLKLEGWSIGDREAWDALPSAQLPPGEFLVVAASEAARASLASIDAPIVTVPDGRIGNGLSNRGDLVRLRGPTGGIVDTLSYGLNLDAFDPAVPMGPPGTSIERIPPGRDRDSAEDWWVQAAPSPGRAGPLPTGPPRIRLNEVLPAPRRVDWDGDGISDHRDEWVELFNTGEAPADLGGWQLEDREADGWSFTFPETISIAAGGFLVLHRRQSTIALVNEADTLRLIRPDGVEADRFGWSRSPGYDRSWSRGEDGTGDWRSDFLVTPGQPNRPRSDESDDDGDTTVPSGTTASQIFDASPASQGGAVAWSALRGLAPGRRVELLGQITAPPGLLGSRSLYIGDANGGIQVYLPPAEAELPTWVLGDRLRLRGRLKDYHGEREIVVERWTDVVHEGPGAPLTAAEIATGEVAEATEGRLVHIRGRVTGYGGPTLDLDDGSGVARIVVRQGTGIRRPWVEQGERLAVTGIVGQYARSSPWQGGYRLMPRFAFDFGSAADDGEGIGRSSARMQARAGGLYANTSFWRLRYCKGRDLLLHHDMSRAPSICASPR